MSDNQTQASGGVGCSTILFFIFLVLKLTNVITWSWWWVFAPLWIPASLIIVIFIIWLIIIKNT